MQELRRIRKEGIKQHGMDRQGRIEKKNKIKTLFMKTSILSMENKIIIIL
jgi:hypothetical protein